MKAVICEMYGPPEVLKIREVKKPVPKDNQVLVKIMATAVNSGDLRVRGLVIQGFLRIIMRIVLGFRGPRKQILGIVLAGEIEAIGNRVSSFKPGDQIYAQTGFQFGAYAEYIALAENAAIVLKPRKATFEEAAAIPFGGTTALYFLRKAGITEKFGQKVLVYGSSGAVGTAAVQIAKHFGAIVTAVCSQDGVTIAKSLGADHIIDYSKVDFTKNGEKYDIVFDAVGKKQKKECIPSLAQKGKYVTVGGLSTASASKEDLNLLRKLYDNGEYKAIIDKSYPLEEIVEAHKYVDQGKKKGNVVITVSH